MADLIDRVELLGLGVTLIEDLHRSDGYQPAYLPVARRRDGTLTDW